MDFKQVQSIIKYFEESKLTTLELETDTYKIKLSKNNLAVHKLEKIEKPTEDKKTKGFAVKSPLVGTFYSAANPKEKPFVEVGDTVKKGQTFCIIEAMKIMNEITAPISGVIESINVLNGSPVGFDEVLMVIV